MKKYALGSLFIAALLCSFASFAQPGRHRDRRYNDRDFYRWRYPSRTSVSIVASLPFGAVAVSFGGRHYHYYDGYYYQPYHHQYIIVQPPVGIIVPALPPDGVWITIGARRYYRFQSIFYLPSGSSNYQVVQKPQENAMETATASATESEYEKIVLEGKTYYKKGNKYYKAAVEDNGEISYKEVGETNK